MKCTYSMDECMIIILPSMHQIREKDRLSNDRLAASSPSDGLRHPSPQSSVS